MTDNAEYEYVVRFTFTTFDLSKSMAMLRSGRVNISSKVPKEEIDIVELKQLCLGVVFDNKPKWNVLTLDIENIELPKRKTSKQKIERQ